MRPNLKKKKKGKSVLQHFIFQSEYMPIVAVGCPERATKVLHASSYRLLKKMNAF